MSDTDNNRPISPERLAEKMARLTNFEHEGVLEQFATQPRHVEALWFIQWASRPENYAGGLRRFARDLVAASVDLLGTATMRARGAVDYSDEDSYQVNLSLPERVQRQVGTHQTVEGFGHWADLLDEPDELARVRRGIEGGWRAVKNGAAHDKRRSLTRQDYVGFCKDAAGDELTDYLRDLCEALHVGCAPSGAKEATRFATGTRCAPWYFVEIGAALIRFMDRWKADKAAAIAETAITREVHRWLGKCRATKLPVAIEGNSRFGKTEAVQTWCVSSLIE